MAAGPYKHGRGWQVKWRESGRWQVELLPDEASARRFKFEVEEAGNRWPAGWTPGHGFGYVGEPEVAVPEDNCTPFLKYARRRIEGLRESRSIDDDTMGKYLSYARLFVESVPVALALSEVLEADDALRTKVVVEPTSASSLLASLADSVTVDSDLCIEDIDRDTIAAWVRYMRVTGRGRKTIGNYHGFLHGVLEEATEEEILTRNPCRSTKLGSASPVRKKVVLEPEEAWLIRDCLKPDALDLFDTAIGTGMRWGELTALQVDDWSSETRTIDVNKAWKRGLSGPKLGGPKTDAGLRTVYVGETIAALLDRRCASKAPGDLIFTAVQGGRLRQNTFGTWRWYPALEAARDRGLTKRPRWHDLRHTHVSWLRDKGLPDVAIKDLVGHTQETMTGKYGSVTQVTIDRATAGIDEIMKGRV